MAGLILASASPRRREILGRMGYTRFEVCPADADERVPEGTAPGDLVETLAVRKAETVAARRPGSLVLAADTVVALDGAILGKPKTAERAGEMLTMLSGRTHEVYTGYCLLRGAERVSGRECSRVTFRTLRPEEIRAYVRSGEPLDKAGAYGIQGRACRFISRIEGDYYNIVGLPACRISVLLRERFGLLPDDERPAAP